jgi:hypothetical protein
MIWAVLSHVWARLKVYKILVGQPKWKKLSGKPGCRKQNNIKMDLKERGLVCMGKLPLAQDSN